MCEHVRSRATIGMVSAIHSAIETLATHDTTDMHANIFSLMGMPHSDKRFCFSSMQTIQRRFNGNG